MPMVKYYLIHWGASLSDTEKQMALNWAKEQRAAFYPNLLADAKWNNETIRPIQNSVAVDVRKVISLNPQLHSRSATYIKRNGLLIRKITIKSSRPFQCAYHPLTP